MGYRGCVWANWACSEPGVLPCVGSGGACAPRAEAVCTQEGRWGVTVQGGMGGHGT